jgi:hypothetical protein
MNTVTTPRTPRALSGKHMNIVSNPLPAQLIAASSAANADQLGERSAVPAAALAETRSGWDSYEVWRRFIKDARDRRQPRQ